VLAAHGRFTPYDEIVAAIVRITGVSLPVLSFVAYVGSLALIYAGLIALGGRFYATPWTTAVLVGTYTLRHRIARTGANTLEGYFHPRMLVFAMGMFALHAVMQRRATRAWLLVAVGAVLHPTTALFFAVWVGVALMVNEPRQRRPLLILTAVATVAGLGLLAIGTISLKPMDAAWMESLTDKDYILPMSWPVEAWIFNLGYPLFILAVFWQRRRAGLLRPGETGLVIGCLALVALFFASLPLLMLRSAIAVQLQMSRVFWMADLLTWIYIAYLLIEMGSTSAQQISKRRAQVVMMAVLLLICGRGWYTWRHDHPDRPLVQVDLPDDDWTDVGRWLRDHTPHNAQLLADPGHAWRFGTSLRVSAERDVFIEDVKDIAIGMYDRTVAMRNMERRSALGDWVSLTPAQFQNLAARYDLQYLVSDQVEPFDEVYHNARFHVYRLQ
jgi:hypothetical protein